MYPGYLGTVSNSEICLLCEGSYWFSAGDTPLADQMDSAVSHCSMGHRELKAQREQPLPQGSGLPEEGVYAATP